MCDLVMLGKFNVAPPNNRCEGMLLSSIALPVLPLLSKKVRPAPARIGAKLYTQCPHSFY
jgi:hypothetical protein